MIISLRDHVILCNLSSSSDEQCSWVGIGAWMVIFLIHLHQYRQVIAAIASQIHGRVTIHRGPSQASEHSKGPVTDRLEVSILSWTILKRHRKINRDFKKLRRLLQRKHHLT